MLGRSTMRRSVLRESSAGSRNLRSERLCRVLAWLRWPPVAGQPTSSTQREGSAPPPSWQSPRSDARAPPAGVESGVQERATGREEATSFGPLHKFDRPRCSKLRPSMQRQPSRLHHSTQRTSLRSEPEGSGASDAIHGSPCRPHVVQHRVENRAGACATPPEPPAY